MKTNTPLSCVQSSVGMIEREMTNNTDLFWSHTADRAHLEQSSVVHWAAFRANAISSEEVSASSGFACKF